MLVHQSPRGLRGPAAGRPGARRRRRVGYLRRARSAGQPLRATSCAQPGVGTADRVVVALENCDRARRRVPRHDEGRRRRRAAAGGPAQRPARARRWPTARRSRRSIDAADGTRDRCDASRSPACATVFVAGRRNGQSHRRRRATALAEALDDASDEPPARARHRHRPGGDHLHLGQHRASRAA